MVLLQHDIGIELPDKTQVRHCYNILICCIEAMFIHGILYLLCHLGPVYTTPEEFKNAPIPGQWNHIAILITSFPKSSIQTNAKRRHFQLFPVWRAFPWRISVGQTVEIKLLFQQLSSSCRGSCHMLHVTRSVSLYQVVAWNLDGLMWRLYQFHITCIVTFDVLVVACAYSAGCFPSWRTLWKEPLIYMKRLGLALAS